MASDNNWVESGKKIIFSEWITEVKYSNLPLKIKKFREFFKHSSNC